MVVESLTRHVAAFFLDLRATRATAYVLDSKTARAATKSFTICSKPARSRRTAASIIWSRLLQKLEQHDTPENLEEFAHSRREDKRITQELTEQLSKTFVTPLEREDIQELAAALYKIPKTVEKIGERILICPDDLRGQSFQKQVELLDQAAEMVLAMVKQLRKGIDARDRARNERQAPKHRRRRGQARTGSASRSFQRRSRGEADHFSARSLRLLGKSDRSLPRRREHHPPGGAEIFVAKRTACSR